jgi:hypothetical protein
MYFVYFIFLTLMFSGCGQDLHKNTPVLHQSHRQLAKCRVDLDKPLNDRWTDCVKPRASDLKKLLAKIDSLMARTEIEKQLKPLVEDLDSLFEKEMAAEIKSISLAANLNHETTIFLNLILENFLGCTSVVVKDGDGGQFLLRNLDYGPRELANLFVEMEFVRNKKVLFNAIGVAGYMGIPTGMSDQLAIAQNSRYQMPPLDGSRDSNPLSKMLQNIFAGAGGKKISFANWEIRKALQHGDNYEQFKKRLLDSSLFSKAAYIIAVGKNKDEGFVFARNQKHELGDEKMLGFGLKGESPALRELSAKTHVLFQTNSDSCEKCNRCKAMTTRLDATKPTRNPEALLAMLSQPPVRVVGENWMTIHSTIMNPKHKIMRSVFYKF